MQYISIDKCIICGSDSRSSQIEFKDHLVSDEFFNLASCDQCGFRYITNPPTEAASGQYYESDEYVEHSDSSKGFINFFYHRARRWMIRYKFSMIEKLKTRRKILDVGTGTGYFLRYMRSKGYDSYGIEISAKARKFGAQNFLLDIREPQELFKNDFPKQFGVISFWHVFEHVYNPDLMLQRIRELLDDDGKLVIALPNHRCLEAMYYKEWWNGYDVPRHLWHFDMENFEKYVTKFGFSIHKTKILPLDPFYNCLISESYRKKIWGYPLIPFLALFSLIWGLIDVNRSSSIVYIFKKDASS